MRLGKWILIGVLLLATFVAGAIGFVYYKFGAVNIPPRGSIDLAEKLPFALPDMFTMAVFADGVKGARVMVFDPNGVLLVSQPSEGRISALLDTNADGKSDTVGVVLDGLRKPHGMAFRCRDVERPKVCLLYVAEEHVVSVFDYDTATRFASNGKKLLDLPTGGGHSTRTLLFLTAPHEDTLLVSVGSSCNVCLEGDTRRASIIAYDTITGSSQEYAKGLRNAVFMQLHPISGKVYVTEMGRDGLGDEIPPDEINIIEQGKNYGWPVCFGKNIHDTDFDKNTYIRNPCMEPFETVSVVDIPAHSAPLGLSFVPEEGWPQEYWYNMLVAYHGSWNRSTPTGYKIVRLKMNARGEYLGTEDFITGWLRPDGTKIGRPADIAVFPGGQIYISDDGAGIIYMVQRK